MGTSNLGKLSQGSVFRRNPGLEVVAPLGQIVVAFVGHAVHAIFRATSHNRMACTACPTSASGEFI